MFREGYDQYCSDEDTMQADEEDLQLDNIEARIGYEAHRKSSEMRDIPKPAKFSQSYPQSESDVEFDVEQRYLEYKQLIEERIELLKTLPFPDPDGKNIKLFTELLHSPVLRQLLEHIDEKNDEASLRCVKTMCFDLCAHQELELKAEELLTIFKTDKLYSGSHWQNLEQLRQEHHLLRELLIISYSNSCIFVDNPYNSGLCRVCSKQKF